MPSPASTRLRRHIATRVANNRPFLNTRASGKSLTLPPAELMPYAVYQDQPERYATEVLKVRWWAKQVEIAQAVLKYPRVFVQASHNVGKTFFAGSIINWHTDCFDPSITKTTAPTQNQVNNLTWKEVRVQRRGRGMLPKAPRIEYYLPNGEINAEHYAAGYTARNADSFQGDHAEHLFILFEEAVGIDEQFWIAADGMTSSGDGNRWLAIMNPTDSSSYAYTQMLTGDWHLIQISALEHPNIMAELEGRPKPYPKAISVKWVEDKLRTWCRKLEDGDTIKKGHDVAWPPLPYCERYGVQPTWYRPDSRFEGRVLGRWPSSSPDAIWTDALFQQACKPKENLRISSLQQRVELGCDVARFGDDDTAIHVRQGGVSLHHESVNGWDTRQTANRLKLLCRQFAPLGRQEYWQVPCKIDDTGVGGGVTDQRDEYWFIPINAGAKPLEPENYRYKRDELWFAVQDRANDDELDFSFLPKDVQDRLRRELLSVRWRPNAKGQREVEQKIKTKERLGGLSPDNADALNLAYCAFDEAQQVMLGGNRDKLLRGNQ